MKSTEREMAGFFSRARWGPGSIIFIAILLALAILLLVIGRDGGIYVVEAAVIFILIAVFVLVKRGERISTVTAKFSLGS
ncbi:MAG: hypothetical protein JRN37_04600 [Nitrososphaerota archaeon]|nr:hypothetical protein [Nitrososphaerota archaeon]MDG7042707.1 hypothetical protein [Nitrososphaerota archaeon]MDG7046106.1 hypothetical protein [Nitrososphaerota archaeon]MDG7047383.1 hypothetical protein [Nitrososphaerota archaeon]